MADNTCPGLLRKILLKSDRESDKGVVSLGDEGHLLRGWSEEAILGHRPEELLEQDA